MVKQPPSKLPAPGAPAAPAAIPNPPAAPASGMKARLQALLKTLKGRDPATLGIGARIADVERRIVELN